jgi:hypothetical protein
MKINYLQLSRSFVLGGIIVASVKYVAQHISSRYAGILWSFPISIIPSIIFMYLDKQSDSKIIKQTKDYAMYFPTLLVFLFVMYKSLSHFGKIPYSIYIALLISLAIWGTTCFILFRYSKDLTFLQDAIPYFIETPNS